jgi:hypothetical protein
MVLLVFAGHLSAQQAGSLMNRGAQYYLGNQDELLIPVNIWGFVQKPGQYMVPTNTDLISLLSYAGGPTADAKISNIKIVRSDPRRGSQVWKVDVKRYIDTADSLLIPPLKPNDTIIVKGTTFYWVARFFEFISRLAVFFQKIAIGIAGFLIGGLAVVWRAGQLGWGEEWWVWALAIVAGILGSGLTRAAFEVGLVVLSSMLGATLLLDALQRPADQVSPLMLILVAAGIVIQWVFRKRRESD